jgi:hypothetical protein
VRLCVNPRMRAITLLAIGSLVVTGCDKLKPAGQSETFSLLRDGSEKVCVAGDVQAALSKLIVPSTTDLAGTAPIEQKQKAIATVALSYELTTLDSFDKAVSKAVCKTTVKLAGGDQRSNSYPVTYQVSPAAEKPGTFVVTAELDNPRAFALDLAGASLTRLAAEGDEKMLAEEAAKAKQEVLATVSDKWLLGRWIPSDSPSEACVSGNAFQFNAGHRLVGRSNAGSWALVEDTLHMIGGGSETIDVTAKITRADPVSFTADGGDGSTLTLRRCSSEELESDYEDDSAAAEPAEPTETPQ